MSDHGAPQSVDVLVVGAGPTGLTAADACVAAGSSVAVVEHTGQVGGLARAATVAGHEVDIGGHRLLSSTAEQRRMWRDLADRLGGIPMSDIDRRSGILRDGYVISYPFDWQQFRHAAPLSVRIRGAASLIAWKLTAPAGRTDDTLDDWVKNRYGPYLSETFMAPHARRSSGSIHGRSPRRGRRSASSRRDSPRCWPPRCLGCGPRLEQMSRRTDSSTRTAGRGSCGPGLRRRSEITSIGCSTPRC